MWREITRLPKCRRKAAAGGVFVRVVASEKQPDASRPKVRLVVTRIDNGSDRPKLKMHGSALEQHDYKPHEVVEIDATMYDMKWSPPPERESPLLLPT